jgi:hypothetical protein
MRPHPSNNTRFQQIDCQERGFLVVDHCGEAWYCPACKKYHKGAVPERILKQGFASDALVANIATLKLKGLSFRGLSDYLKEACKIEICAGSLNRLFNSRSEALAST